MKYQYMISMAVGIVTSTATPPYERTLSTATTAPYRNNGTRGFASTASATTKANVTMPTTSTVHSSSLIVDPSAAPAPTACTPALYYDGGDAVTNGGFGDGLSDWDVVVSGNAVAGITNDGGSATDASNTNAFSVSITSGTGQVNLTQPVCLRSFPSPNRLSYRLGVSAEGAKVTPGNTGCVVTPYIGTRLTYSPTAPCGNGKLPDLSGPPDRGNCLADGYNGATYYEEYVLAAFSDMEEGFPVETYLRFVFDCDAARIRGFEHPLVLDSVALPPVFGPGRRRRRT